MNLKARKKSRERQEDADRRGGRQIDRWQICIDKEREKMGGEIKWERKKRGCCRETESVC